MDLRLTLHSSQLSARLPGRASGSLSSTDLADVPPSQTHQCGEPVRDVQQSFGDPSTAFQQWAVDKGHSADPTLPVGTLEAHSELDLGLFDPLSGSLIPAAMTCPQKVLYLASSQRPVAASGEGLGAVICGVDDDAVAVVPVLPQSVGDVSDRLVHRGHHGGQLSSGDVRHVAVRVDVGLGGLERSVNRL